jgi:diguanylate cyclase (GGDEF)-like protein/PAS domain S-box-containing protein
MRFAARARSRRGLDPAALHAILEAQQKATQGGVAVIGNDGTSLAHNGRLLEIFDLSIDEERTLLQGQPLAMIATRTADPRFFQSFAHSGMSGGEESSEATFDLTNGRTVTCRVIQARTGNKGTIGTVWVFTDQTEQLRAEKLQSALFRISEISRSAGDLHDLFASLHSVVDELMDATNFFIALHDESSDLLDFAYFVDEVDSTPQPRPPGRTLTGYVLRTGMPLLATPATFEELTSRGEVENIGAPSVDWLGAPLISAGKTFGTIVVQSYDEQLRYGETEREILMFVARHVAAAIEQKRREDALRESETRYRQMFRNNQAVKLVIDPASGDIIDANPSACEFYGWSPAELKKKKIWEINVLTPDEIRAHMAQAQSQQRTFFVFKHRLASGEIRDVEVHSGPIEVGGRSLLYSIIHDITERRKTEKQLRRSEEHFRSLIENASDMIAIVDVQGTFHYSSPSVKRILGYDPQSTVGGNIFDIAHPEDVPLAEKALGRAFEGQEMSQVLELRVRHHDGSWRHLEGLTHRLEAESAERLVVNCRDVTDRKLAEQKLLTHSAAMEASMDGIAIIDSTGHFTYVNQALLKLFGYRRPGDLIGARWTLLAPRQSAARFLKKAFADFERSGEWRGESEAQTRDGHRFSIEASLTRIATTRSVVCVVRDTTERAVAEEQIRHLAYHDALTGLPNRLLFRDRLTIALQRAQREKQKVAVMFLDLDRFKIINDSLGHDFGDALLQEVGRRISGCLRETDTVSRLGGDEFTILLPSLHDAEDAAKIARKVLAVLRKPMELRGREYHATTSIGIAIYPDDGSDVETLQKNADTAMYGAKEHGRDTYQIYNSAINAKAMERLEIENGLRHALVHKTFVLHYQPIFDLRQGRIHGMEALIRWKSPDRGLVPPAEFIPVAESSGLMRAIGDWVLATACRQAREWHTRGFTNLSLAVNLSMTQLQQPDLVEKIATILEVSGMPPGLLQLEITESVAMERPEETTAVLQRIAALGVRISLDDFGIGHSSLNYLRRFPAHTLKIDQSFIQELGEDQRSDEIVKAIIAMGHTLRMEIVAEGVEQDHQRAILHEQRCDLMQGFLFHPAIPADEFEAMLLDHNISANQWTLVGT